MLNKKSSATAVVHMDWISPVLRCLNGSVETCCFLLCAHKKNSVHLLYQVFIHLEPLRISGHEDIKAGGIPPEM